MKRDLKIAFSGNSGVGKSFLCNYVQELGVKWMSTSAGDILTPLDKAELQKAFGYKGTGHKDVINLSAYDPQFGWAFQRKVLNRRADQIFSNSGFVIDRAPIDNVVYMLTQISHQISEDDIKGFIQTAQMAYAELTHVIRIVYSPDIPFIEDNGSRIPNRFFQQYISDVFTGVYSRYFANIKGPRVLTIDFWDAEERKRLVREFIKPLQMELPL